MNRVWSCRPRTGAALIVPVLFVALLAGCGLSAGGADRGATPSEASVAARPDPGGPTTSAPRPTATAGPTTPTGAAPSDAATGATAASPPAPSSTPDPDCATERCIALTFDDGPSAVTTPLLLDELDRLGVRATFFVLGQNVAAHPEVVARAARAGHVIGNHTWDHPDLTRLSSAEVEKQLTKTSDTVAAATGARPTLVRPPYGKVDAAVTERIRKMGDIDVLWSVDTEDWKSRSTDATASRALAAGPGAIVLLHDIHPWSVAAVPQVVAGLRAQGYRLVTVPQLFGGTVPPGARVAEH